MHEEIFDTSINYLTKNRNSFLDLTKAVLIFLVILGHTIQLIGYAYSDQFWNNYLFKFIYTFHMPLFIGISGYLTYSSVKKYSIILYFKNRILYLLIPMLLWCIINFLIFSFSTDQFDFHTLLSSIELNYWFVWAIILFSLIICTFNKLKIDNIPILLLSIVMITLIPFNRFQYPLIKSMYPFFLFGYILASIDIQNIINYLKRYSLIIITISIICFFFWNKNIYPYITPSSIGNIKVTLFRIIASSLISISTLIILHFFYSKFRSNTAITKISLIGKETLSLYLIQGTFFGIYNLYLQKYFYNYRTLFCIFLSIIIAFGCSFSIKLISKNKTLGRIAFGKK